LFPTEVPVQLHRLSRSARSRVTFVAAGKAKGTPTSTSRRKKQLAGHRSTWTNVRRALFTLRWHFHQPLSFIRSVDRDCFRLAPHDNCTWVWGARRRLNLSQVSRLPRALLVVYFVLFKLTWLRSSCGAKNLPLVTCRKPLSKHTAHTA
jgi:hypothetical protein